MLSLLNSAPLRCVTFSFVSSQVSRRQVLALPRRALQRAGVAARGPPADRGLPRGQPLSGLRRHRRFNLPQQEVLKHQKDRRRGVSTTPPPPIPPFQVFVSPFPRDVISFTL